MRKLIQALYFMLYNLPKHKKAYVLSLVIQEDCLQVVFLSKQQIENWGQYEVIE